ncbi:hypothetical protein BD779DRAFT_73992 [Infundibulicybe gibba]|nr:hypothetical protein BD779DRAFT_73992 [Infundibulicybe gibba]
MPGNAGGANEGSANHESPGATPPVAGGTTKGSVPTDAPKAPPANTNVANSSGTDTPPNGKNTDSPLPNGTGSPNSNSGASPPNAIAPAPSTTTDAGSSETNPANNPLVPKLGLLPNVPTMTPNNVNAASSAPTNTPGTTTSPTPKPRATSRLWIMDPQHLYSLRLLLQLQSLFPTATQEQA